MKKPQRKSKKPRNRNKNSGLTGNQSKIAKQAGDPNKIEGADFAALRGQNQTRQTAQEGGEMAMPPEMMGNMTSVVSETTLDIVFQVLPVDSVL